MALVLADRVKETTTTTGTGTVTLLGASAGFQSFAVVGNANTTYYTIAAQVGTEWEVGIGTYTSSGTTLARTTVLSSSNGGSAVNFSAGLKDVFVTYPSEYSVSSTNNPGTAGQVLASNGTGVDPTWVAAPGPQAGGVIYENSLVISSNYTLTAGKNAMSVGPITISSGAAVTVPSGQRWIVF